MSHPTKRDLPMLPTSTRGQCEWHANGTQCQFPGSVSHGQLGGGPWYCGWHFRCSDGAAGARIVEQSHEWDGRPESYLAMRRAYVYGIPKEPPMREPGQDESEAA
jgi:hypothetical protein